jgi:hypothetical protein
MPSAPQRNKRSLVGRIGSGILVTLIVIGIMLGVLSIVGLFVPDAANLVSAFGAAIVGLPPPYTRDLPDDATAFDPLAQYELVRSFAGGDVLLTEIDAYYVKPDGTLDLLADYGAWVRYEFVRAVSAPPDAPPIGAGGSDSEWYEVLTVQASRPGTNIVNSGSGRLGWTTLRWVSKGLALETEDATTRIDTPVEVPRCSFRDLWAYALEDGAPQNAVATINYDENGYYFLISGTEYNYQFTTTCEPR